jgi:hypothetical protein
MRSQTANKAAWEDERTALLGLEQAADGPLHTAANQIHRPFVNWLPQAFGRYRHAWDQRTGERFENELQAAQARLTQQTEPTGPLPTHAARAIAATLDSVEVMARAIDEQHAAFGRWAEAQYALDDALARVLVMFSPRRRLVRDRLHLRIKQVTDPAVTAAQSAVAAFGDAARVLLAERDAGRLTDYDNVALDGAFSATGPPSIDFATTAGRSARRLLL